MTEREFPIGQRVHLPGHFPEPVILEAVRPIGSGYECRVRLPDGRPDETILSEEEVAVLLPQKRDVPAPVIPADAEKIRLLVESARIRLAYAHDPHFAVSLSGIRTLPHQIEAVYLKMLPQPRLRFLLADDPGAGKTIMAGLLIKELKLREAIDRVLILCPAPLTIQWQDELLRWFGEPFEVIFAAVDQQQLVNPWRRASQVIASIDYAKQDEVRERVWQEHWDLVIIDEAHKCSAYTKSSSGRSDEVEKTKRYQLAERLAQNADHLLLLTATPHHGDDDRFAHFIRLLDRDVFPEPHRVGHRAQEIRRDILRLGPDCPWALRRLKEDLRDLRGRRLFPDRHAHTVTFRLNREEYDLYKAVTAYINQFLPQVDGRRKASVALARTVLQRRLASSTMAIYESIRRRLERQQELLRELEQLTPAQRARRLAQLQGHLTDGELDEDDLDDTERDRLLDNVTAAVELDQLRTEIAALQELLVQARRVRDHAADSKLAALRECLNGAEFRELNDGRGKLLIFTEHRDTLNYLCEHLERWGYTTCQIHGGMNPHERKRAQELFRTELQICVATEAAGEGINLQFCRLMINYDLPWNPTRLEQRLGRIHRIGQERDVHVFNFVANESEEGQPIVEGRILHRLLEKLDKMRAVLADRVFDVIGQVLSLNDVNLPDMLREAASDPRRLDDYLDQIERIDPEKLRQYEQATGIALARAHVDISDFQQVNAEAEERRLMPRYVEAHFLKACQEMGLRVEPRADGLWRIEHVLADLRSDRLKAVRRLGKPEPSYRKITFHKERLDMDQHLDAVLLGPGHPLYAAVDERLNEVLSGLVGSAGVYLDEIAEAPYRLHFFEIAIRGESSKGEVQTLHAELVAVREELAAQHTSSDRFSVVPADCLLDLPAHPLPPPSLEPFDPTAAADFLKGGYQMELRSRCQQDRCHFVQVCREYLERSFDARIRAAQDRIMALRAREVTDPNVALARQRAEHELADLERARSERLEGLNRLMVVRHGPVRHVATALVLPAGPLVSTQSHAPEDVEPEVRRRSEKAAEDLVVAYETARGWECERVGHLKIGFDIRSLGPADSQTGYRDPVNGIRRIEVKGRSRGQSIRLTTNEWYKAAQLGETYWLYVVWDPLGNPDPEPLKIRNPVKYLDHTKREVVAARYFDIPAWAIEEAAQAAREGSS
ncbi:SNF2-related [Moorella glycerini]|uniref:RNA polymerase-associated protein RapA n=1 Tax=Neomoorella stamsii TaxID=1266720 RepID=A0A9X7J1H8_9FIRM|nr:MULTISPECIES: helicase-related protein [Moorella]PRR71984.1 RNA polymerase-associated protein RapA [Moorella stamsii]CEP66431.1 SNF2-related [Moorella glycerini]